MEYREDRNVATVTSLVFGRNAMRTIIHAMKARRVKRVLSRTALVFVLVATVCARATAEDWSTYEHDNARTGITTEPLAPPLSEQWVFTATHAPEPAWTDPVKEMPRVRFDDVYHVVVAGDSLYFGSSADNKVYSLDASTGKVRWVNYTGGPVRLAPAISNNRVYVGSDDGYAYCLRADDGGMVWKVRGAYSDKKVLGNGKMISLWPVRTGVLVDNGIAYFGAGVFPHEGIFVCAVKADDGSLVWRNDACGEKGYTLEFGGMSPQGYLLASENTLFVPSGRAMPAAFDRKDGRLLYWCNPGGHFGGTWALLTGDRLVAGVEQKKVYDKESGKLTDDAEYAWFPGLDLIVTDPFSYMLSYRDISAIDRRAYRFASTWRNTVAGEQRQIQQALAQVARKMETLTGDEREAARRQFNELKNQMTTLAEQQKKVENAVLRWQRPFKHGYSVVLAGDTLFAGGDNAVIAINPATGQEIWNAKVDGKASGIAVANGRLFVSTDKGKIYGFAKGTAGKAQEIKVAINPAPYPKDELTPLYEQAAENIVTETGIKNGYCFVYGSGKGRLAFELAKRTDLKIIGIEPDGASVEIAKKALDEAGLYGARVTIDQGDLSDLPYADYFANLIVSDTITLTGTSEGSPAEVFRVLKPCGGIAYFGQPAGASGVAKRLDTAALNKWLAGSQMSTTSATKQDGSWVKLTRGPLEGAGKWTHQYAEPGNTACSDDQLVKAPLGVLWFGRPGPEKMVERHARAAAPVAMNGRMFVQGENVVMAYDAYNGVLLWEKEIPGALRVHVDSDMGNLALAEDGLYVAAYDRCFRLDPATGKTVHTYSLPPADDQKPRRWGYVACDGKTLFGSTAQPFKKEYGAAWHEMVKDDGTWRSINEIPQSLTPFYINSVPQYPEPDETAYAGFQQSGAMWRDMMTWPDWGSVRTPQGALTPRIMASDTLFAADAETGKFRWIHRGQTIAHPAITIGDGTIFFAECAVTEKQKQDAIKEKQELIKKGVWEAGEETQVEPVDADVRLVIALDSLTGKRRWERVVDLTGCGGDRMGMTYKDGILLFFGCFSNHDRGLFREGALTWRRITALSAKDGTDMWSRPLNYLRRPVVIGDTILIEPRMCDIRTGKIKSRVHPLTGREETWEFVRPGHCCSISSAAPNAFFLRGYFLWYYDLIKDQGMQPFGGMRPGCWINTIPANGLVLVPEASAGCTCSYPIVSTVVLKPEKEYKTYSILIQHGEMTPVQHMAVNFGAPGDWKDDDGTLWFSYPHPPGNPFFTYGVDFKLQEKILPGMGYFSRNLDGVQIKGTNKPWLFASGCSGLTSCVLPLIGEGQTPAKYAVRLYFAETDGTKVGQRVFHIKLQGKTVLKSFDILKEAGSPNVAVVKEFKGIKVQDGLTVELVPEVENPKKHQAPVINGIEVIRES